jgi:predicted hydrocarbon binding protein
MKNPYKNSPRPDSEEMERRADMLRTAFSDDYEKAERGESIRPRLGDLMSIQYMRERQTLSFVLHPELKEIAYEIGYRIGRDICSDMIRGKTLPEIMQSNQPIAESISYAFEEIVEADEKHAVYRHYECADCYGLPDIHDKVCVYEAGVAAGMFSEALGKQCTVTELKCCANGDPYCEFLVEVTD